MNSVLEIELETQVGRGSQVHQLLGGYEDYLEKKTKLLQTLKTEALVQKKQPQGQLVGGTKTPTQSSDSPPTRVTPSNNQKKAWEKEQAQLEQRIEELEQAQAELHRILADDALYEDQPKLQGILEKQRTIEKELGTSFSRWEELGQLLAEVHLS
ncbi:MAG: ABC transporter C-terminal domain-containing protein [Bdellovibrionia bacterium]